VPILHSQYAAKGKKPDGSEIDLPPAVALSVQGPVVQVTISLSPAMATPIIQQGGQVPTPVSGLALIDTGASGTCVDVDVANQMGLPVVGMGKMTSASHEQVDAPIYAIQIQVAGLPLALQSPRALGANLKVQGLTALIGRDALAAGVFVYSGLAGSITLCL
jgi:predicted aspartyl protease